MEAAGSLDRAIDLLFHLRGLEGAGGVSEIARGLERPKASTHRLLRVLTRRGLVEQREDGRYALGSGLIELGVGALAGEPLLELARPHLLEEASVLGETVFLTAPRQEKLMVLDKAEGRGFLRAAPRVGSSVPVHATAVGKLAMAFAPEAFPLPREDVKPYTARTLRQPTVLAQEVERARQQGFALNQGEWIDGLSVVAAPILDVAGDLVGAIAVAAASARMRELGTEYVATRTCRVAAEVAARLGARPAGRGRGA
jgi:DNA-binding IclR family transcriptional regulator